MGQVDRWNAWHRFLIGRNSARERLEWGLGRSPGSGPSHGRTWVTGLESTCQIGTSGYKSQLFRASGGMSVFSSAADAGYGLSDYVQISLFVTKVLIRKRFCRLASVRELTNLET
jgi:hypothetical protein